MVWFMGFNSTFNNISVISWRSVLFLEEAAYSKKTTDLPHVADKLSHYIVSSTARLNGIRAIALLEEVVFNPTTVRS